MSCTPEVHPFFELKTSTWQYIVADAETRKAVIIDPVLDFDPASNSLSTDSADSLLSFIEKNKYEVTHILETHVHADHLTASRYLQRQLVQRGQARADVCIGKRIQLVQSSVAARYSIDSSELESSFDHLFDDDEQFLVGSIKAHVLYLPGHTPDHIGYVIGQNVFTGDSIFNPDVGSARCDFPGGSATALYSSMQKLLALPLDYRLYTGHDYPPETRSFAEDGRKWKAYTTVKEQIETNKHVGGGVSEDEFIKMRTERDDRLSDPRLIHQSLQLNVRGGRLPQMTADGYRFLSVPLKAPESPTQEEPWLRLPRNTFNSHTIPLLKHQSHFNNFRPKVLSNFSDVRTFATYRRCYPRNLSPRKRVCFEQGKSALKVDRRIRYLGISLANLLLS
jgi:glyoxylase-like metal-dependent hydrolase (beta-lactamase superfamily II)